jgi:hypothetical protein
MYEYTNTENEQVPETLVNCSFVLRQPDITAVSCYVFAQPPGFILHQRTKKQRRKKHALISK